MTPANTSYSGSPPAASRTDEEDHGESSKEDIIHVSSDAYSKRRNDDATASSNTTDHVATSSTSLLLDSSTNMNATVARARPTSSSSPTRSTPPSCSSPRKPLLSTTQTHDFYGRGGGLGHHASSFRRHEHEQDLPGEKYRLRQQGEITSCDTKNDEERPGSSEALFLRFAGEQREKSTEKLPSLDAGISEPYHAIDARTFSGSDLHVQLPHKPSHPFHSQSSSNISESSRDIGKVSKEQVKEAIIEKMNTYFESKYNTQVSNKFPQKLFYIVDSGEYSHLIQWNDDGDAFQIKNLNGFVKGVLLQLFKQTKFESFHRKLNRWRFSKVRRQRASWRHPFFQKGRLDLCTRIKEGSAWSSSALTKSNIKDDHINMKQEMLRNQQDQGALGMMNQSPQLSGIMMDRSNPTHLNDHPSSSTLPVANGFMPCSVSGAQSQQLSANAYIPLSGLNQHISNQPILLSNTIQNNIQYNNNQSQPAMNQWNFRQPISFTDQSNVGENQERHNLTSTSNQGTTDYVAIPVQALMGNMPIGLLQNATGRIQEVHNVPFEVLGRQQSDMGLTPQNVDIQKEWEELPQEQGLNNRYNADGNFYISHLTTTTAYPTLRDDKICSDQQAEK